MTVPYHLRGIRSCKSYLNFDQTVRLTMWPKHGLPMTSHEQDRHFNAVRVRGNVHEMVTLTAGRRPNGQSSPTLALHSAVWATRSRAA